VGVTLVPIIVHRRLFGEQVKDRVVATGHVLSQTVTALLALLLVGIITLVFSATLGWGPALVAAAAACVVLLLLLVVAPAVVVRQATRED
jgi:membrane protein YdbS with pleckstrin-like domain